MGYSFSILKIPAGVFYRRFAAFTQHIVEEPQQGEIMVETTFAAESTETGRSIVRTRFEKIADLTVIVLGCMALSHLIVDTAKNVVINRYSYN